MQFQNLDIEKFKKLRSTVCVSYHGLEIASVFVPVGQTAFTRVVWLGERSRVAVGFGAGTTNATPNPCMYDVV